MKILFIPYSLLQVKIHLFLSNALIERGHSAEVVDVSEYIAYRNDYEKNVYRKALGSANYSINVKFYFTLRKIIESAYCINKLLFESKPDCVVVGLDSDPEQRLVVNICKRLKVPVILIQDGLWIFKYPRNLTGAEVFVDLIRSLVSVRVSDFKNKLKILFLSLFVGDLRTCGFGLGGCHKVAVFSNAVRQRLLSAKVTEKSIVVTGNFAAYLDNKDKYEEIPKKDSIYSHREKSKRLLIISQPLSEIDKELELRVFSSVSQALEKLTHLGWEIFIRLHPRETPEGWKNIIEDLKLPILPVISHEINWNDADVVLGFVSSLLANVIIDKIPLVVYMMNHDFIDQRDFILENIEVCNDCKSLVEKVISSYYANQEKLNKAAESAKNVFGLRENVLMQTVNLIESFKS